MIPFRPADRAEDHGVGGFRLGHGRVRDALLARVIGRAADQPLLGRKMRDALRIEPVDQALHLRHHFGADAVAGEKQQVVGGHGKVLVRRAECLLMRGKQIGKRHGGRQPTFRVGRYPEKAPIKDLMTPTIPTPMRRVVRNDHDQSSFRHALRRSARERALGARCRLRFGSDRRDRVDFRRRFDGIDLSLRCRRQGVFVAGGGAAESAAQSAPIYLDAHRGGGGDCPENSLHR